MSDYFSGEFERFESSFDGTTLDAFKALPDVSSETAVEEFNYDRERQRAKIKKFKNDNKMRKSFFKWASLLTFVIITINSILFAAYLAVHMWGEHAIPDVVMISWVTSTIVEVLGIVTIIAKYLFPSKRNRSSANGIGSATA